MEFFLLQDLVDEAAQVRFFMPFDGFNRPAKPKDLEEYLEFRRLSIEFVEARNRRIDALPPVSRVMLVGGTSLV